MVVGGWGRDEGGVKKLKLKYFKKISVNIFYGGVVGASWRVGTK